MSKEKTGESTQETLVLPVKRSFVGKVLEVSYIPKGGKFNEDAMAIVVKNLETKEIPVLAFIPCSFLAKAKSKLSSLFQGNVIDITLEKHEAFKTGFYDVTNGVTDSFMSPHKFDKQDAYVVHMEADIDSYRDTLLKYVLEERNSMVKDLQQLRSMNKLLIENNSEQETSSLAGMR